MPDASAQTPALIIEELNGQRRTLTLTGRALPYRPIGFPRTQRVSVTWYPGNAEGTSTVLGSALEPTTFQGKWKEKFLGGGEASTASGTQTANTSKLGDGRMNGTFLTTVRDLVRAVDSFIDGGALLKVTWFSEVRRGHITKFDPQWDNTNDVAWSLEFDWIGKGDAPEKPPVRAPVEPSAVSDQLSGFGSAIASSLAAPPAPMNPDVLGALQSAVSFVEESVQNLTNAIDTTVRQGLAPYDAARRTISVLSGLVGQATFIATEVLAQPPESMFYAATGSDPTQLGQGFRAAAALFSDEQARNANRLRRNAAIARAAMLRDAENDLLAVYEAREGDDLRVVAALFYGAQDQWRALLVFNQLTSSALVAGQLVLVPRAWDDGAAGNAA